MSVSEELRRADSAYRNGHLTEKEWKLRRQMLLFQGAVQERNAALRERDALIDWIGNHVVIEDEQMWQELPEIARFRLKGEES